MRLVTIFLFMSASCLAGEYAVLASGSRLHVERHETDGARIKLYNGNGYVEMDAAQVSGFEPDGRIAAPATPVAVADPAPVPEADSEPVVLTPIELADAAADRYGLPHWLVREVMHAESGYQPGVVSPKGAIGLMQLMPQTAQVLGVNPRDPAQNADAGARYLKELLDKYDGHLWHALAAYNAGPGAVEKYKGIPPFRETIQYINRIERERKKNEN
jgi:soluble lytic murein transglycosylase-like protein